MENWSALQWENAVQIWMQYADHELTFHVYTGNLLGYNQHLQIFVSLFTPIAAAGGIVTNPSGDVLLIHRKGHWDLPKGKVDAGESTQDAAMREVEEETQATHLNITGDPIQTLHVYTEKKRRILKTSTWYPMHTDRHQELLPQIDEEIDIAEWVAPDRIQALFPEMYPMIRVLLQTSLLGEIPDNG